MKSGYVEQQELTFCLDRVRTDQTKSGFPVTEIWVENCEHTLKNISSRICYTRGDNYVFLYIILVTCWLFVALLQIKYSKLTTIYLKCKSDQNEITETLTAIFLYSSEEWNWQNLFNYCTWDIIAGPVRYYWCLRRTTLLDCVIIRIDALVLECLNRML